MAIPFKDSHFRLGILGGGQLGKMLCQETSKWGIHSCVLDASRDFPAAEICSEFTEGRFTDFEAVLAFGQDKDVLTIEIESVNSAALHELVAQGKTVHPAPDILDIIKDKSRQKQSYLEMGLPTSDFKEYGSREALMTAVDTGRLQFPFVVKARRDGYDGRGVAIIKTREDLTNCFDVPSIVEPLLDIELEISVVVARNIHGQIKSFPPVGMTFHPTANLVEVLFCPSGIGPAMEQEAIQIAQSIADSLGICGLLAVEMFVTTDGEILINEAAPRPHNSGHHTIEACSVSQFQQHLRAILGLPLMDVSLRSPAAMVNVLGEDGFTGNPIYEGIDACMNLEDVHVHLYGKPITKPFRKMGHVTVMAPGLAQAIEKANFVRQTIKVKA